MSEEISTYYNETGSDIGFWHWLYWHDFGVPDTWLVQSTVGFVTRTGLLAAEGEVPSAYAL